MESTLAEIELGDLLRAITPILELGGAYLTKDYELGLETGDIEAVTLRDSNTGKYARIEWDGETWTIAGELCAGIDAGAALDEWQFQQADKAAEESAAKTKHAAKAATESTEDEQ